MQWRKEVFLNLRKEGKMSDKLGNHVIIKTGKLDANASSPDGIYPFFTCSKDPLQISSYSYDCECVLVAGNGDLNVKYYDGKFDAYQRTYIIESLDKTILYTRFLYYFLDKNIIKLRNLSIGGIIKYIKLGNLTDLPIKLPKLSQQKEIVATLDKANELIALRKKQLEELDTLAEVVFYDMFGDPVKNEKGWHVAQLGSLGNFKNGLNYKHSEIGTSLKILGISDFKDNKKIDDFSRLSIIKMNNEPNSDYYLNDQDIVFVRSNGSKELVGRSIIVYPNDEKVSFSGFCIRFRNNSDKVIPSYLIQILSNRNFRKTLFDKGRGCNINNVNQEMLSHLSIPLPPLALQTRFAVIIEKIEEQKAQVRKALQESEDLFQRLMQDLFKTD